MSVYSTAQVKRDGLDDAKDGGRKEMRGSDVQYIT
jgi:hypothetical protein